MAVNCVQCGSEMGPQRVVDGYPYIEGLVHLNGVEVSVCPSCGNTETRVPRVEQLHQLIANVLATKGSPLRGAEIRFLRKHLGWSGKTFAENFATDPTTVSKWEHDKQPMDARTQLLLRVLVRSGPLKTEYLLDFSAEERRGFWLSRATGSDDWRLADAPGDVGVEG